MTIVTNNYKKGKNYYNLNKKNDTIDLEIDIVSHVTDTIRHGGKSLGC